MKYLLMIFNNPDAPWTGSAEDHAALEELFTIKRSLRASGELVSAEGLDLPANAKTIRVRDGVPAVTDGPFGEAKEHLAGYFLVECDSVERAIEIAASTPAARVHAIELRPVMDFSDIEGER